MESFQAKECHHVIRADISAKVSTATFLEGHNDMYTIVHAWVQVNRREDVTVVTRPARSLVSQCRGCIWFFLSYYSWEEYSKISKQVKHAEDQSWQKKIKIYKSAITLPYGKVEGSTD